MTFWERVRKHANDKVREAYASRYGDLKCRCCGLWAGEVGGVTIRRDSMDDTLVISTCNQCKQNTHWLDVGAPVMFRHDIQPALKEGLLK